MAQVNVVRGNKFLESIQTANQSIGQLMTFVQNKKALEEQTREFNVGKGLDQIDKLAKHFGGYNIMAQEMGADLPELMQSFGLDKFQSTQLSKAYNSVNLTPSQITSRTILEATNKGFDSPEFQRLLQIGGERGAPDVTTGVVEVGDKALGIAGDLLEGFVGGKEGVSVGVNNDDDPAAKAKAEAAAKAEADRLAAIKAKTEAEQKAEIDTLSEAYLEALKLSELPANASNKPEFLRQAGVLKQQVEQLGGTVPSVDKGEIKISPKLGGQGQITGLSQRKVSSEKFNLHRNVSSIESSYTDKFSREPLGVFPTGFQGKEIPDALNGGIPTTQVEFNKLQSPTPRDKSNLKLAESFKTGSISDEKRNSILNLMDGTYQPSPLEGAALIESYKNKALVYLGEVRAGKAPPLPLGIRRAQEASLIVAESYVNEIPMSEVPLPVQREAGREMFKNATTQQVRDNLSENIDMIIAVSKNPALATYFMPTAEANRLENKQLSQADARLLANKDITSTNQLLGVLNFLRGMMSKSAEGNEALILSMKGGEKAWLEIQSTTEPGSAARAQALQDTPIAKQYELIAATLLGVASGKQAGDQIVQYSNLFERIWNVGGFFNFGGGEIETLKFIPQIAEPVTTGADKSVLGTF